MDLVEPIMGVRHWDPTVVVEPETVTVRFEAGWPVALNGAHLRDRRRSRGRGQRHRRPPRPRHVATRSRTASSRPRAGASTRRPGMALLHIAYERLVTAIHNEATIENYRTMGRRLGRLLYEGRWFDPQSLMLREPIQRWVGSAVTGEVTRAAAAGRRLHDPRHHRPRPHLPARAAVDGAGRGRRLRARSTASGSSTCATSTSTTPATSSTCTAAAGALGPGRGRRRRARDRRRTRRREHALARPVRRRPGRGAAGLHRQPAVRPAAGRRRHRRLARPRARAWYGPGSSTPTRRPPCWPPSTPSPTSWPPARSPSCRPTRTSTPPSSVG